MKLTEIAAEITQHLKKFEGDPVVNAPHPTYHYKPYYNAYAFASGRYVGVVYISYQNVHHLSKADALAYLEWLRAGNIGTHHKALRDK